MTEQTILLQPYLIALIAGAMVAAAVLAAAWRRRDAPGAKPLFVFSAAAAWWVVCYAFQLALPVLDPLFWLKLMYAGIALIPPAFLIFALEYTGHRAWVTQRLIAILAVEPLLINSIAWTDAYHGLLFNGWPGPDSGLRFSGGSGFWVHTAYSYLLLAVAIALLVHGFLRASTLYRRQAGMVIFGSLVPLLGNVLTITQLSPFPRHDLTPLGLVISTAVIAGALFWRGLFDLMPVARNAVVEHMRDGVLVLDDKNRIIDLNPAAKELLNIGGADILGQPARQFFAAWPGYSDAWLANEHFHDEIVVNGSRYIDLRVFSLAVRRRAVKGKVAVLRDITQLRQAAMALQAANEQQQRQLEEIQEMQSLLREQAIRDSLTGLYNRRFLEEMLVRELSSAERTASPVSIVIIDLDHFKSINDRYGHGAGDALLQAMGSLLRNKCRSGDVACRYGGEEFVVILPGAHATAAVERADQWRITLAKTPVLYNNVTLNATFSAGAATYPEHGADVAGLLEAADKALYAAKQRGRNRVIGAG